MNEETIRADFEKFMSDDGKFPRAIERCGAGNYILSQSASSWSVWRNAYHQCLQSPEIQALREDAAMLDWLDAVNAPFLTGWVSSVTSYGNVALHTVSQPVGRLSTIRSAITAAMEQQI